MVYKVYVVCEIKEGEPFVETRVEISPQILGARITGMLDNGLKTAWGFVQPHQILGLGVLACDGEAVDIPDLLELIKEAVKEPKKPKKPKKPEAPAGDTVPFSELLGVGSEIGRAMWNAGLFTMEDVDAATDKELLAISGIGPATLKNIRAKLRG